MLDQNTTTVLTTLITVLGTLGGVVLGVILSNRYVARQEKAKRNITIIEEIYTLLTKVHVSIVEGINNNEPDFNKKIRNDLNRVLNLICLYLPTLKGKYDALNKSIYSFTANIQAEQKRGTSHDNILDNISETLVDYSVKMRELQLALEKLVR
jgi:hypothetical protein